MKTKEFIERMEALNFVGKAEKGMSGSGLIGFPNKNGEALISVNEDLAYHFNTDYRAFRQLHLRDKRQLANIAWEYASTPLVEREEEKRYVYKLPVPGAIHFSHYIKKSAFTRELVISELGYKGETTQNQFTDKEIEQYTGKVRALFDACEKIEVTPHD